MFRVSVQSRGVQSHYFSEAFRAIIFQSQRSEHRRSKSAFRSRRSESAFRAEALIAIIFQRCSKPSFFKVCVQSIDVQSQRSKHRRSESAFKLEAFIAIIFQSQHLEHRRSESAFRAYD